MAEEVRCHVIALLQMKGAHLDLDAVIDGIPQEHLGVRAHGLPYSLWELLEHMRIAQGDILEFCRNPAYEPPTWPRGYWPATPAPPNERAWTESAHSWREDCQAMQDLVADTSLDLASPIPHGSGQTYLREALLVADHNSWHLGQMMVLRRLMEAGASGGQG
jgi:hypothetical protein